MLATVAALPLPMGNCYHDTPSRGNAATVATKDARWTSALARANALPPTTQQ